MFCVPIYYYLQVRARPLDLLLCNGTAWVLGLWHSLFLGLGMSQVTDVYVWSTLASANILKQMNNSVDLNDIQRQIYSLLVFHLKLGVSGDYDGLTKVQKTTLHWNLHSKDCKSILFGVSTVDPLCNTQICLSSVLLKPFFVEVLCMCHKSATCNDSSHI